MTSSSFLLLAENKPSECQQDENSWTVINIFGIIAGFVFTIINLVIVYLIVRHKDLHKAIFICICNAAFGNILTSLIITWANVTWVYGLHKVSVFDSFRNLPNFLKKYSFPTSTTRKGSLLYPTMHKQLLTNIY